MYNACRNVATAATSNVLQAASALCMWKSSNATALVLLVSFIQCSCSSSGVCIHACMCVILHCLPITAITAAAAVPILYKKPSRSRSKANAHVMSFRASRPSSVSRLSFQAQFVARPLNLANRHHHCLLPLPIGWLL